MSNLTTTLCLTLAVLLGSAGMSFALPPCPSNQNQYYDNCFGTYTYVDGSKYVGEYRNGKQHGQGTYTYVDGDKYVGECRNGKQHGQGTYTFGPASKWAGDKYVGEFKDGNYNGRGTLTYADGRIEEGTRKDDEFQYAPTVPPTVTAPQQPFVKPETDFTNKRIALVVGNANYNVGPLNNPVRDAHLIGTALKQYGFKVILVENVNYRNFRKALARFSEELGIAGPKATAFFYYSGHGMSYQGNNYLVPLGSEINSLVDIDLELVRAERVHAAMGSITSGVKIMLLDACRNNPFKSFVRSRELGLVPMNAPRGTIVGYSTSPGRVALDGEGRNSPYALGLVRAIKMPDLTIESVLKQTLNWVDATTNGKQMPWYESSLRGNFYFNKN